MLDRFKLPRLTRLDIALSVAIVYAFLAFLPSIHGIKIGLDPSWTYAISRAAESQWVFGRDIIFTYGPLGYLTQGAAIKSNIALIFLFRYVVHFIWMGVVLIRLITLQKRFSKFIFTLGIVSILGSGVLYGGTIGLTTDYQILFTFLILLSFERKVLDNLQGFAIFTGVLTGFAILSKLTLGVYIAGSFYLFVIGSFFQAYRRDNDRRFGYYLQAIVNFTIVAISSATIFLSPASSSLLFIKILGILALSIALYFTLDRTLRKTRIDSSLKTGLARGIAYLFYGFLFVQAIDKAKAPSLLTYLQNSWQISSGYSSAMSVIGDGSILTFALISSALITFLLYRLSREGSIGLAFALLFCVFLSFKHGFVRQDGHVLVFSITAILITLICIVKLETSDVKVKNIVFSRVLYTLAIAIILFCWLVPRTFIDYRTQIRNLSPARVTRNISTLIDIMDWGRFQERASQMTSGNLVALNRSVKLPDPVLQKVRGRSIDIIPWEFSIVPANDLNWKQRPIIQAYSAYTEKLDEINFQNLSGSPRDFIFYHFESIDGRHPFFDEPRAFSHVVCHYKPESIPEIFTTDSVKLPYFLLDRQNTSRCATTGTGEPATIAWNTIYELPTRENSLTRANIEFQYSSIGKLVKLLFRIPPVYMNVNYLDGTSARYRIVQDNSVNGPIVSHLPRDKKEITAFLQGELPPQVKSFQFEVVHPWLFRREIAITPFFETYR